MSMRPVCVCVCVCVCVPKRGRQREKKRQRECVFAYVCVCICTVYVLECGLESSGLKSPWEVSPEQGQAAVDIKCGVIRGDTGNQQGAQQPSL